MLLILLLALALPAAAQFTKIEIKFEGIGCASCIESLPARMQRMRGVTEATIDAKAGLLSLKLAPDNRIRLEQVRDAVEQDGTKARSARVTVRGEVKIQHDFITLHFAPSATYQVMAHLQKEGIYTLEGEFRDLHPATGPLAIESRSIDVEAK